MSQQLTNSYNMDIGPTCPITLNPLKSGETRVLKCGHTFSEEAIKDWIEAEKRKNHRTFTCPQCRVSYSIPNSEEEFNIIIPKNFELDECINLLEQLEIETTAALEEEKRLREEDNTLAKEKLEEIELNFLKIERELNENQKNQREKQRINERLQLNAALNISLQQKKTETSITILENHIEHLKKDRKLTPEEMKEKEIELNTIRVDPIEIIQPKPSAPLMKKKQSSAPLIKKKQPILEQNVPVLNPEEELKRQIESKRRCLADQVRKLKQTKEEIRRKKEKKKKERFKNICTKDDREDCFNAFILLPIVGLGYGLGCVILIAVIIALYIISYYLLGFILKILLLHQFLFVTEEINQFTKKDFFVLYMMKSIVNNTKNVTQMPPPFNSYQNLPWSYESRVAIAWIPITLILILVILYESTKNLEISKRVYGTRKYFLHITYLERIQSFINWEDTKELQEIILAKYHSKLKDEKKLKNIIKVLKPRRLCDCGGKDSMWYMRFLTNAFVSFYYVQQLLLFIGQMYYNKRILLNYYPESHPIINIIVYLFSFQNLIIIVFLISSKIFKYKWCCREFKRETLNNKKNLMIVWHYMYKSSKEYRNGHFWSKEDKYLLDISEYEETISFQSDEIKEINALFMLITKLKDEDPNYRAWRGIIKNAEAGLDVSLCTYVMIIFCLVIGSIIANFLNICILFLLRWQYSALIVECTNDHKYGGSIGIFPLGGIAFLPIIIIAVFSKFFESK